MGKESCPGPTILGPQQAALQATQATLTPTQAVMLSDVRALKLAPNKTECHFLFLSNAVLFQHCLLTALVQRFGGQGGTWEKERKKVANYTKPFPGKAQALGCSEHVAALPLHAGALALLVEAQTGIHPIPHVQELSGRGRMAACISISLSLCVYI